MAVSASRALYLAARDMAETYADQIDPRVEGKRDMSPRDIDLLETLCDELTSLFSNLALSETSPSECLMLRAYMDAALQVANRAGINTNNITDHQKYHAMQDRGFGQAISRNITGPVTVGSILKSALEI